jgi:glycosyltransferase involved in cell wall biosynthesis
MRIAVWHNLPSGGAKRAVYDQVRGLKSRGHELTAWCPPMADQTFLPLSDIIEERVVPAPGWPEKRGKTFVARAFGASKKLRALDRHARLCAREILDGSYDILLAHPCGIFFTNPIGRHLRDKLPAVLFLQEPNRGLFEALPDLPWFAPPKVSVYDILKTHGLRIEARHEVDNARAFHRILVNSYFSRESILRAYGSSLDVRVCYLGIDTRLFHPFDPPAARENFVVSVGTFNERKNPRLAIETIARVPAAIRPVLRWIANEVNAELAVELKHRANVLSVQLTIIQRATEDELVSILNRAKAMLYTPHLEPFGFVPLEAGACGTPAVGVAEGGVRETIQDGVTGFLANSDPADLAEKLIALLKDERLARATGERAAEFVQNKWNLASALDRLESHLNELAGQNSINPLEEGRASNRSGESGGRLFSGRHAS